MPNLLLVYLHLSEWYIGFSTSCLCHLPWYRTLPILDISYISAFLSSVITYHLHFFFLALFTSSIFSLCVCISFSCCIRLYSNLLCSAASASFFFNLPSSFLLPLQPILGLLEPISSSFFFLCH